MDLKQAKFGIQLLLGRISAIAYDPLDPSMSDILDVAKQYAGFLLDLGKCYTTTDDEHGKNMRECVALYDLHLVFDGLVRNYEGKYARAKASEVLVYALCQCLREKAGLGGGREGWGLMLVGFWEGVSREP